MSNQTVYGIATSQPHADLIVERLTSAGFASNDISALFPDTKSTHAFAHEKHTKAPEGAIGGVAAGGAIGGGVGLLAGLGALAIPGIGPLIAAGPLLAALSGAAVGAAVGGIAGALIGMGVSEFEAKRYEGRVKDGNILISLHTGTSDEASRAKDIFHAASAEDVCRASVAEAPGTAWDSGGHTGSGGTTPPAHDEPARRPIGSPTLNPVQTTPMERDPMERERRL